MKNYKAFIKELIALCDEHNIYLTGNMKIVDDSNYLPATAKLDIAMERKLYGGVDRTGPFLIASIEQKESKPVDCNTGLRVYVSPDIKAYDCPITGKIIDGKKEHRENLKRTGCRNLEPGESRESQKRQESELNAACKRTAHEMVAAIAHQVDI